jgi:NifU-like protein involved in Fe-S cluster formation
MSETLYNTAILRLAAAIPHTVRLAAPQASVVRVSPVCGSKVTVDLDLDDAGRVARFGQEVRACALGQASAALLGGHVVGRSEAEIAAARDALAAYLKGDAATPGDWPGLDLFAPARPHKARHGSILLAFQAAAAAAEAAAVGADSARRAIARLDSAGRLPDTSTNH